MSKEDKAYIVQLVKQIVHPYFAGEIADILIAHGMTFKTEPRTKGDRIRAMSDEELAEWIHNGVSSDACDYCEYNNGYCDGSPCRGKAEAEMITDWLKQPAEPPKEETT